MLAKLGCSYVVVGHSERREHHAEDDATVNAKAHKAVAAGMTPIVCVGEGLDVRQAGRHVEHTLEQLDGSLAGFDAKQVAALVVAYEPVWAIGTGEVATPDDAQEVCAAIRARVAETLGDEAAGARTHPVRRLGQGRQRRRHHAAAGCRRRARRRREPAGRRVRRDLPLLCHAGHLNGNLGELGSTTWLRSSKSCWCISSLILILLVLLHKGRGGGLSDMFGGGMSSSSGGSSVAERNLDRITVGIGGIWIACIVGLGLLLKTGA